jgi:hypothetical protein
MDDEVTDEAAAERRRVGKTRDPRAGAWGARLVAAVIALQVAVPAVALLQEPPARFGFQMYSGYGGELTVLDARGDEIDVAFSDLFARYPRPELRWDTYVVEHLCAEVDGSHAVSITQGRRPERVVPCR